MSNADEMEKLTEEIFSSYESRISAVCAIVDNTHQILDGFSKKRSAMRMQLKKRFSREKSFREKDFDSMMEDILGPQEAMEKETRILLNNYIDEQKEADETIRQTLEKHMKEHIKGDQGRISDFRNSITDIQARQRDIEELHDVELRDMLKTISCKHRMTIEFLHNLLLKEADARNPYLNLKLKNKHTRSEGWWEVFEQMVSHWRESNMMEGRNMYMAQRRLLTVSNPVMLEYFNHIQESAL